MWKRLSILSSLIWSCCNNHAAHTCAHSLWRRQIGDKIDTHIPWARKHFFASTTVLRVIVCFLLGFVSLFLFIVLFSSGHRWPYFVSWNFSFIISFSSRRRSGLVLSLRHFHVHASSVLRFVDCATCKTPIRQLFAAFVASGSHRPKQYGEKGDAGGVCFKGRSCQNWK